MTIFVWFLMMIFGTYNLDAGMRRILQPRAACAIAQCVRTISSQGSHDDEDDEEDLMITSRDDAGETITHKAAALGLHQVVSKICAACPEQADVGNHEAKTPLHIASLYGHHDCVQALCHSLANVHVADHAGQTPLHLAAEAGHVLCAALLIRHGANINAQDLRGRTPLHKASQNLQKDMIDELINLGADTDVTDLAGNTPAAYIALECVARLKAIAQDFSDTNQNE